MTRMAKLGVMWPPNDRSSPAGNSFPLARSPEPPKMTSVQGCGTSGWVGSDMAMAFPLKLGTLFHGVAAEGVAHSGQHLFREGVFLPGPEPGEQGGWQRGQPHRFVDRLDDRPYAPARVL